MQNWIMTHCILQGMQHWGYQQGYSRAVVILGRHLLRRTWTHRPNFHKAGSVLTRGITSQLKWKVGCAWKSAFLLDYTFNCRSGAWEIRCRAWIWVSATCNRLRAPDLYSCQNSQAWTLLKIVLKSGLSAAGKESSLSEPWMCQTIPWGISLSLPWASASVH